MKIDVMAASGCSCRTTDRFRALSPDCPYGDHAERAREKEAKHARFDYDAQVRKNAARAKREGGGGNER